MLHGVASLTPEIFREEFMRRMALPPREVAVDPIDHLGYSFILGDLECCTALETGRLTLCFGRLVAIVDVKKKYNTLKNDDRDIILLYRVLVKLMRLLVEFEKNQPPQAVFEVEVFTDALTQIRKMRTYVGALPQNG
jgi:hypothetical protein